MKELFERQTRVLIEQFRSELRTVAEQYGSIQQKLQEHDLRFDRIDERFTRIDERFTGIETQFSSIVVDHEKRLQVFEKK